MSGGCSSTEVLIGKKGLLAQEEPSEARMQTGRWGAYKLNKLVMEYDH